MRCAFAVLTVDARPKHLLRRRERLQAAPLPPQAAPLLLLLAAELTPVAAARSRSRVVALRVDHRLHAVDRQLAARGPQSFHRLRQAVAGAAERRVRHALERRGTAAKLQVAEHLGAVRAAAGGGRRFAVPALARPAALQVEVLNVLLELGQVAAVFEDAGELQAPEETVAVRIADGGVMRLK